MITSERVPKGGHTKLWGFGYASFAAFFSMSEGALRQTVRRGLVDLASLESIVAFREQRLAKKRSR